MVSGRVDDEGHFALEVSLCCFTESRCADAGRRVAEADLRHVPFRCPTDLPLIFMRPVHTWVENCRNARGCFSTCGRSVQSGMLAYTAVLHRYKPNMNVKTTTTLLDICLKWCFNFSFHFEGVLLAVGGCTSMFRGCSRTLNAPNSPPLRIYNRYLFLR